MVKSVIKGALTVASRLDDNKLVLDPEKCECFTRPKKIILEIFP